MVFHHKDVQVAPEAETKNDDNILAENERQRQLESLQSKVDQLEMRLKSSSHGGDDPKAGVFFDAIFNDVEAQQKSETSIQ